nr:MAG TPA: hypothetical protein [Bacteriophage sp.]
MWFFFLQPLPTIINTSLTYCFLYIKFCFQSSSFF